MIALKHTKWRLPLLLILLAALPIAASLYRTIILATQDPIAVSPDEARFFEMPMPILIHVLLGTAFLILGAFQMSAGLRQSHKALHRRLGWAAAPMAILFSLSGVWMVFVYPSHSQASILIDLGRVIFGVAITIFVSTGVYFATQKNFKKHRAWMIRGYTLAASTGIQSYLIAIATVINGSFDAQLADTMMILGWVIAIWAGERIIARKKDGDRISV